MVFIQRSCGCPVPGRCSRLHWMGAWQPHLMGGTSPGQGVGTVWALTQAQPGQSSPGTVGVARAGAALGTPCMYLQWFSAQR